MGLSTEVCLGPDDRSPRHKFDTFFWRVRVQSGILFETNSFKEDPLRVPPKAKPKQAPKKSKSALKPVLATLLLDETGSMMACKAETISGFNEYVKTLQEKVKKGPGIALTLVTFNSEKLKSHYVAKPIADVPLLTEESYVPSDLTPLYDAIGKSIHQVQGANTRNGNKSDVLFIIFTDGQENASVEYDRDKIFKLIEQKKKAGWTFIFLGANQDAWECHAHLGVPMAATLNYQGDMKTAMRRAAIGTARYAVSGGQRVNSGKSFFSQSDEPTSPDEDAS